MLWRITDIFSNASDIIIRTFLALFLWQTSEDLYPILIFGVSYFAAIPVAALIGGALSNKIAPKIALLTGIWMQITQIILLIAYGGYLNGNIDIYMLVIIGLIGGLGEGLKNVARRDISDQIRSHANEARYYAGKTIQLEVLNLFIPLTAAYLISTSLGYLFVFKSAIIILLIESFLTAFIQIQNFTNTFSLKKILTIPGTNPYKLTIIKGVFMEGLSEGITLTILPIITLVFVGSIVNWGILNTALVLVSIFTGIILQWVINDVNSKSLYAIGAVIYASACLFFIARYNFYILTIFLLTRTLMNVIKNTGYYASIDKLMSQDVDKTTLFSEYQFLIELFTSIGRVIPILLFIVLNLNISDEVIIRVILIALGLVPLFTLSMLGKSGVFNKLVPTANP